MELVSLDIFKSYCNSECMDQVLEIMNPSFEFYKYDIALHTNYVISGLQIAFQNNNSILCSILVTDLNRCHSTYFMQYSYECFKVAIDKNNMDVMLTFLDKYGMLSELYPDLETAMVYALNINKLDFIYLVLTPSKYKLYNAVYKTTPRGLAIQTIYKESKQDSIATSFENEYCDIIIGLLKGNCERSIIQVYFNQMMTHLKTLIVNISGFFTFSLPIVADKTEERGPKYSVNYVIANCLKYRDDIDLFLMFYISVSRNDLESQYYIFSQACKHKRINVIDLLLVQNLHLNYMGNLSDIGFIDVEDDILKYLLVTKQIPVTKAHIKNMIMITKYVMICPGYLKRVILLLSNYVWCDELGDEMEFSHYIVPEFAFIHMMQQRRINPKILNSLICELDTKSEESKCSTFVFYRNEYVMWEDISRAYYDSRTTPPGSLPQSYFMQFNNSLLVKGSSYIREYNIWRNSMYDIFSIDCNLPTDLCNVILS
jgi:hypothetical protein